jgi:hypothetical protein
LADTDAARDRRPSALVLLAIFLVLAFVMTFRDPGRFATHVVGDAADGLLVVWILGWVQHAIPHGWDAIWNANSFHPAPDTLAYAESMLPVAIAQWPLKALFGTAVGLNILSIAAETASLWFMYRLALRLSGSWPASIVAALAFSFASPRLSQLGHTQLTLVAFLVPLTFLLLVEYFDRPRLVVGVGIGVVIGVTATSAAYYGGMMAVAVAVFVAGYLLWFRPRPLWPFARSLGVGALVAAAIVIPVARQYTQLQDSTHFQRDFVPRYAAHASDFLAPSQTNYLLTELPVFQGRAFDRSLERRLFPGMVAFGFGVVGLVAVVRAARLGQRTRTGHGEPEDGAIDEAPRRARLTLLLAAAGLVCVMLAFGDEITFAGATIPLPFRVLRDYVPGFKGIRVTSRFVLVGQCALAVLAALGVRALLGRLGSRAALAVAAALGTFVILETAVEVPTVRVPDSEVARAVGEELADRPDGVVVELPMKGPADGQLWGYLESPRQYASLIDANPRVNGYSGFFPEGFDDVVTTLDKFPKPAALRVADEHDVRYVVLRTRVLGVQSQATRAALDEDGVGRYTEATAERLIDRIPLERIEDVTELPGAYLVELRPPR